jgi:hypothetical protein
MKRSGTVNRSGVWIVVAGLGAGLLAGCHPTQQFSGMLRYDNLLKGERARQATINAREQLIARAAAHGLEPVSQNASRIVFRMQAPRFTVTLDDGTTEERVDTRIVHIEARLDNRVGQDVYRYYCWIEGGEPGAFGDEDRARFGLALLALREIFETPIAIEILGG